MIDLNKLKKECLVYDTETWSEYSDGTPININANFDDYVSHAVVKWCGFYSYKNKITYLLNLCDPKDYIIAIELFKSHAILVGFNTNSFDYPIITNNMLIDITNKYYNQVDCMTIMGKSTFKDKDGYAYKNRGELMKFKFKKNSMRHMAEVMGFEVQKGEIDYTIFKKNKWTEDEIKEIRTYLKGDIVITKNIFDALWEFWKPFTEDLNDKYIRDLSWIRNSIASLTYKTACSLMDVEPIYGEHISKKEDMGGRVIMPTKQEIRKGWYIDYRSLYPHLFVTANLFSETMQDDDNPLIWHGNDMFKVKGYYNICKPHKLTEILKNKLKQRIELQENDPTNPLIFAIKTYINTIYGICRSALFEQVHTPNCGYDCCFLGQQIHELTEEMFDAFGFKTEYGDTDGLMVFTDDESIDNEEYVAKCCQQVVDTINEYVPFPVDTFKLKIECRLDYIMFPFSLEPIVDEDTRKLLGKASDSSSVNPRYIDVVDDKKKCIFDTVLDKNVKVGRSWVKQWCGRKKNYAYIITEDGERQVKLMGLPIKKDNATALGIKIYNEVLKPIILEKNSAKFDKSFIEKTLDSYLQRPEIMELMAREFKVRPEKTYKSEGSIYAQISKGYFNGNEGVIKLIKNNVTGNAGKGWKYCKIEEAIENKLTIKDIDLTKLWNELEPFIKNERLDN